MIAAARWIFFWLVLAVLGVGMVGGILTSYLPSAQTGFVNQSADGLIFSALYTGLFVAIFGLGMCLAYAIHWQRDRAIYVAHHWAALRQVLLFAIGTTALVALYGFGVLSWLDGILLGLALTMVELSFHVKPV